MMNRLLMAKKSACSTNKNIFCDYSGNDITAQNTLENGLKSYRIYGAAAQTDVPTTEYPSEIITADNFDIVIASKNLLVKEQMYQNAFNASPTVVSKKEKDGRECVYFAAGIISSNDSFTIKFKENTQYTIKTTLYYETSKTSGWGVVFRIEYTDGTSRHISPSPTLYNTWMSYVFTSEQNKTIKKMYYSYNIAMPTYMDMNACAVYEGVYTSQTIPEFTQGKLPYIVNADMSTLEVSSATALHGIKLSQDCNLTPTYTDDSNNRYIADYIAKNKQKAELVKNIETITYTDLTLENTRIEFENLSQYNNEQSCVGYIACDMGCINGGESAVICNYFSYLPSLLDVNTEQSGIYPFENKIYIRLEYSSGIVSITDSEAEKKEKFKQWLIDKAQQGNALVVMYAQEFPQIIDISECQLGQDIIKLNSMSEYMNIYNTKNLWQFASIKTKEK